MKEIGSDLFVVLYSLEQKCFHLEKFKQTIEHNINSLLGNKHSGYFVVGGLFNTHTESHEYIDLLTNKLEEKVLL